MGDWKAQEDSWRGYWIGNKPDDAENWVAVEHNQGGSYHASTSDECLSESNMAYIQSTIIDAFPDDVITDVRAGDFAIRALRKEDPGDVAEGEEPMLVPTEAWAEWVGIENALKNYPILDEDDFSEREDEMSWEETKTNVDYLVGHIEDLEPIDDLPEDWIDILMWHIYRNIFDYRDHQSGANGIEPKIEHVIEGMLALHYFKRLRDYLCEDVG